MSDGAKARATKLMCIVAAAVLLLAACGEEQQQPSDGGRQEPGFKLVEEGRLTVGSDIPYPPFEFEEAGELTGFDVEIVQEVAERIGLQNEAEDWLSADFGTIFQQLQTGTKFDVVVAAVTAYAPEGSPAAETVAQRRAIVDFSTAYYPSLQSLTVNVQESPDVEGVDDLPDGARVGVQRATTGAFYAEENLAPRGVELVSFEKAPPMYQQLSAGQLDAVFNDLPVSLDNVESHPGLEVVEEVDTGEEYGIAVAKDNPELLQAINVALEEMFADGTYAEIFKKYFPEQPLPDFASE